LRSNGSIVAWGRPSNGSPITVPPGVGDILELSASSVVSLALVSPPPQEVALQQPTLSQNGFTVLLRTISGRFYQFQFKNSLADPTWTSLPLVAGNGELQILTDPSPTPTQRFHRVLRW
jgi:hypothetical protein